MKVGRVHTWNYDAGLWKETKVPPGRVDVHLGRHETPEGVSSRASGRHRAATARTRPADGRPFIRETGTGILLAKGDQSS